MRNFPYTSTRIRRAELHKGVIIYILAVLSLLTAAFIVIYAVSPGFRWHTARYAHRISDALTEPSTEELEARLSEQEAAVAEKPDEAGLHMQKAETLVALDRQEEALGALEAALLLEPDYKAAILVKARTLAELDKPAEAIELLEDSIARLKDFHEGRYYLSELLLRTGRADEALHEVDEALGAKPGDIAYMHRRADVLLVLGRYNDALGAYDKVLLAYPDTPFHDIEGRTVRATIQYGRGVALNALGRFDDALKAGELADKQVPNGGFSLDNRIYAHAGKGEYDDAARLFETNLGNWDMTVSATVYGYAVKKRGKEGDERRMHQALDLIADRGRPVHRVYAYAVLGDEDMALKVARDLIADKPWMKRVMSARLEMKELLKKPEAKELFGG